VGIQTVNNVLFDKVKGEYASITEQVKDLCYGLYGRTTLPIDQDVSAKALKGYPRGETPITSRPGDVIEPELKAVQESVKGLAKDLDDELIVALYPLTGKRFLEWKYGHKEIPSDVKPITMEEIAAKDELVKKALNGDLMAKPVKETPEKSENVRTFDVYVDGDYFKVEVDDKGIPAIAGSAPRPVAKPAPVAPPKPQPAPAAQAAPAPKPVVNTEGGVAVEAPMPGMVISYEKKIGDHVTVGETVMILEAMKMYNNIPSPVTGTIAAIPFSAGDSVGKGDALLIIKAD
jgi:pyruvate carboxylase subunit B